MHLNKASIFSVCLLALRIGVAAAPTENINTALIVDQDHNITSVADGHLPLGNTGIEFPVPVAGLERRKAKGSSKGTSRKPSKTTKKKRPTKPKPANSKVTSKAKLSPTKSKSVSKSASKTKSAKDPYGSCKPKKGAKGTKGTKTKGKKGVKREEEGFTPISDEQYHSLAARDRKILQAGAVELQFPTHPSSGDAIRVKRYKADGMKAYGTVNPDPCDDDYALKVVTYPTAQGQGLIGENWDTEHVMDAQIIQQFFEYLNDNLPTTNMPAQWWSRDSQTGKIGHFQVQRAFRYMRDFWEDRKGTGGITATDHLLAVYPGTHQYTGELTLLGHGINRKKESIFGHGGGSCIGSSTWRGLDYWGKVDKLRECVLLAKYMNHADIQDSFEAVATRIKKRLTKMEDVGGFMESTDDYWARKMNNNKYLDRQGEVYKDQRLDRYWQQWLKQFMATRLSNLSTEITTKLRELDTIQKGAQKDRNLSQQRRDRIASRYRRIDRAWTATKPLRNPAP
ncbi:hypothetical protein DPSP01_007938 [Paraphaeosphaeria sporulosa]